MIRMTYFKFYIFILNFTREVESTNFIYDMIKTQFFKESAHLIE